MHGLQGRDRAEVTQAAAGRNCSGWQMDPDLQTGGSTYRGVVMSDNRSPVLDVALVALLVALAFDALSTALIWGLVQHLPF